MQERFRNSLTSCKAMPGTDCGRDHVPVVGTMRLKLKWLKKAKTAPKLQINMLENEEISRKYRLSVKKELSKLEQLTTAEEKWQMMKQSISESSKEHIPVTKRKEDKKSMNLEILGLIGERRKAKANEQKYKELDKQIKKRCNEAKENWINTQCEEIEGNNKIDIKTMHQKIRDVTGKKSLTKIGYLRSRDGNILIEK